MKTSRKSRNLYIKHFFVVHSYVFYKEEINKNQPSIVSNSKENLISLNLKWLMDKQTKYRRASLLIIMCYRIVFHLFFFYLPKSDSQLWLLEEEDLTASPPESSAGSDITRSFPLPTNTKTTYKKLKTNFNKSKTTF